MFKRHEINLLSYAVCNQSVCDLSEEDFYYYDKDGFELNKAEQKFYRAMNYPIDAPILNHCCWQQPWFELEKDIDDLLLDHCLFLCRCNYEQAAAEQLTKLKPTIREVDYLLKTKRKWGFDFALDAVNQDGDLFEVLHIEYDNFDFDVFSTKMVHFEWIVRHTDWRDVARRVWENKDDWLHLKGFGQNDWKANYVLGWRRAEYTEKTV